MLRGTRSPIQESSILEVFNYRIQVQSSISLTKIKVRCACQLQLWQDQCIVLTQYILFDLKSKVYDHIDLIMVCKYFYNRFMYITLHLNFLFFFFNFCFLHSRLSYEDQLRNNYQREGPSQHIVVLKSINPSDKVNPVTSPVSSMLVG